MIELYLFLIFMIIAAIAAIEIRDLLGAVIALGAVSFSGAIIFIIVQAPDLAIVQIAVETLTIVIFTAVILRTTRLDETLVKKVSATQILSITCYTLFAIIFLILSLKVLKELPAFGNPVMKIGSEYLRLGLLAAGGANVVADIILDFRALDTLAEATVLFTSVVGVLAVMRRIGKKI